MTTRYYLDNGSGFAEVVGRVRLKSEADSTGGLAGLTRAAKGGEPGIGGVVIDDPLGVLDIRGWRPFYVEEDEATPSRIWTGFINARRIEEMDFHGVGRIWDCDLGDLNLILGLQVWRGIKRAAEKDYERVAWMLAHWPAADYPVYDNGWVTQVFVNDLGELDLDGVYPDSALSSMTLELAMFFVYWDHTATAGREISLMWGPIDQARGTLTVGLSNDPSEINGETVFAAYSGQTVTREPGYTYSGEYMKFVGSSYYGEREDTADTYIRRDKVVTTDRIGKLQTARNAVNAHLRAASTEQDTVVCTVEVRNDQVNLIREGYLIPVKFTHLPGYTTTTLIAIQQLTLRRPDNGNEDIWLIDLEMSNKAPASAGPGGGDPGDFPHQPPAECEGTPMIGGTPAIVQKAAIGSISGAPSPLVATFPSPPTPGNEIIAIHSENLPPGTTWPAGYTPLTIIEQVSGLPWGSTDARTTAAVKTVVAGEGSTVTVSSAGGDRTTLMIFEVTAGQFTGGRAFAVGATLTGVMPNVTTTEDQQLLIGVASYLNSGFPASPPTGWTLEYGDAGDMATWVYGLSGGNSILTPAWSRVVTPGTYGGETFSATLSSTNISTVVFSFEPCISEPNPPGPAQPVNGEIVVMDGADGTTAYPYAAGSLKVFVDNTDQTAAVTERDPTCGDFTLAFTPTPTEQVVVFYQGA